MKKWNFVVGAVGAVFSISHVFAEQKANTPQFIPPIAIDWSRKQQKLISERKASHQLSGIASYYGKKFHGKTTANGEKFDMHALSAAHRTLPFNTIVRVVNFANGKHITVRINDRGPFLKNRVIDLSLSAAKHLSMVKSGTAFVTLEIVSLGNNAHMRSFLPTAVQVASYTKEASARSLVLFLEKKGIFSQIEDVDSYYRVVVPVSSSTISQIKTNLSRLGFSQTLIRHKRASVPYD